MKKIPLFFILILTASGLPFSSCRKFVEIEPAPNLIETKKVFENEKAALSAVSSVYAQMRFSTRSMTNGGLSIFGGLLSDEIYNTVSSSTADPFFTNSLLSNNAVVTVDFWNSSYSNIYRINAILEALPASVNLSDAVRHQFSGEMKVTRVLYYFYLSNLFGDVPLITGTDYKVNAIAGRTAVDSIYKFAIRELNEAKSLLSSSYSSLQRARPNLFSASSLLARIYLYQQQWLQAATEASSVIDAGMYSLGAILPTSFQLANNEIIWQVASDNSNSSEGANFLPSSSTVKPQYALTTYLLNIFENGDQRKVNWLNKNTIGGQDYYYPSKYKNRAASPITEYDIVFRLAEQYLIRAEARLYLSDLAGARSDINEIRRRAGLFTISSNDPAALLTAIFKERQTELFTEWGHRWLDLKRTGNADVVLTPVKGSNWQSTDLLFPIPFSQLQVNPNLTQNPGY